MHFRKENKSLPLLIELLFDAINQDANFVKSQLSAFVVKIKVDVMKFRIANRLDGTFIGLFDGSLSSIFRCLYQHVYSLPRRTEYIPLIGNP